VPAVPLASSPPSLQIAEQAGGLKRRRYWQGRRVPPSERVGTRQPGVTIAQKLEVLRWVKVWWLPQTEASVVFSDRMYFNRCALCCAVVASRCTVCTVQFGAYIYIYIYCAVLPRAGANQWARFVSTATLRASFLRSRWSDLDGRFFFAHRTGASSIDIYIYICMNLGRRLDFILHPMRCWWPSFCAREAKENCFTRIGPAAPRKRRPEHPRGCIYIYIHPGPQ